MKAGTGFLGRVQGRCLYCREGVRKGVRNVKAQLELNLARDAKNNKNGFPGMSARRRSKKA